MRLLFSLQLTECVALAAADWLALAPAAAAAADDYKRLSLHQLVQSLMAGPAKCLNG